MSAEPILTAAVVGGGFAGRLALDALTASHRFQPVAVAEPNPTTRRELAERYHGLVVHADVEAMLQHQAADVMCISTPPVTHAAISRSAMATSVRGLLLEKPLCHSASLARELLADIVARQIPVAVPHGLLVQATALEVIDRVRNGEIGELELIEIRTTGWDILNAGIHWLNYCVRLLGDDRVERVLATCDSRTRTYRDGLQVETVAATHAETVAGARIVMISGDHIRLGSGANFAQFRLSGSAGQIELEAFQHGYRLQNAQHPAPTTFTPPPTGPGGHQQHLERLAALIDARVADVSAAEESLAALEICEAAYVSSRHRCEVRLPLSQFAPPTHAAWDPGTPYSGTGGGRDGRNLD